MLLTLTTTHRPATDLSFLLHKHPDRLHSRDLGFGQAHVFYPEATEERCTAALLLEIDPVSRPYINDRPYVASSFLSAALFEWTRAECRAWAEDVGQRFAYEPRFDAVGVADPELGPPTQMVIFRRCES